MSSPYDCSHPETQLRRRTHSNGTVHYQDQCLRCGNGLRCFKSTAAEVREAYNNGGIPDFDHNLRENFLAQARSLWEDGRQQRAEEYDEYLLTAEWRGLRARILARDHGICQGCLEQKATQVHHETYSHIRAEFAFELVSLCDECHARLHGKDGRQ